MYYMYTTPSVPRARCQLWHRARRPRERRRYSTRARSSTALRTGKTRAITPRARDDATERFYDAVEPETMDGMTTTTTTTTTTKPVPAPRRSVVDASATVTGATATQPPLRRLEFVREATERSLKYVTTHAATRAASETYARARDATALKSSLTKIETMIAHYGTPMAQKVVSVYPNALATADAGVDKAVAMIEATYDARVKNSAPMHAVNAACAYAIKAKEKYPENIENLKAARAEYLSKIERAADDLRRRAVKVPEEAMTTLKSAITQAREALDSDKLFARVKLLWEQIISNPTVVAVVKRATPVAEAVLAQPVVKRAVDIATPYAVKAVDIATPYATAIGKRVLPKAAITA